MSSTCVPFVCKSCGIVLGAQAFWISNGTDGPMCRRCAGLEFHSCPSCQSLREREDQLRSRIALLEEFVRAWDEDDKDPTIATDRAVYAARSRVEEVGKT